MELEFVHRFIAASNPDSRVTVLALHGTGGDESDLIPLARMVAPGAAILSPRGKVLENGMPRFFRRLREGVFDEKDVRLRAGELSEFIHSAAEAYHLDEENVIPIGYSNGANIAAAVMLLHPGAISRAVLFRPMVPLQPPQAPDLSRASVFIAAGRRDPIVPPAETERLAAMLRQYGAHVTLQWTDGGHELAAEEIEAARRWLGTATKKHEQSPPE
jgi:phospholipase/carboxylesterase/glyoxalase family protein